MYARSIALAQKNAFSPWSANYAVVGMGGMGQPTSADYAAMAAAANAPQIPAAYAQQVAAAWSQPAPAPTVSGEPSYYSSASPSGPRFYPALPPSLIVGQLPGPNGPGTGAAAPAAPLNTPLLLAGVGVLLYYGIRRR